MKMYLISNGLKSLPNPKLYRVFNALFYTAETSSSRTRTPIGAKPKYQSNSRENLYQRIAPLGNPNVSMVPVLEKWAEEVKSVTREVLASIIRELRVYSRYKHALEVPKLVIIGEVANFVAYAFAPTILATLLSEPAH